MTTQERCDLSTAIDKCFHDHMNFIALIAGNADLGQLENIQRLLKERVSRLREKRGAGYKALDSIK